MTDITLMNQQMSEEPIYIYNKDGDRTDISTSPRLESQDSISCIEEVERKGKSFVAYSYNGVPVPRVTSILEYCKGDQEYLLKWAAGLGENYSNEKRKTLDIGTRLHEAIAEYMVNGTLYTIQHLRGPVKIEVRNCFRNFLAWYDHIKRLGIQMEVIASEVPLVSPWFGGTADLILVLNGRRYIVDFKSSKRIYDEYLIQVSAYKWLVDNYYPEYGPIDGVGILRFDKVQNGYEDLFLDIANPADYEFICNCQRIFGSALNMFYAMNVFHKNYIEVKKQKESHKGKVDRPARKKGKRR